jgi:hypothetical protein
VKLRAVEGHGDKLPPEREAIENPDTEKNGARDNR